jgi:hypothetical protein
VHERAQPCVLKLLYSPHLRDDFAVARECLFRNFSDRLDVKKVTVRLEDHCFYHVVLPGNADSCRSESASDVVKQDVNGPYHAFEERPFWSRPRDDADANQDSQQ